MPLIGVRQLRQQTSEVLRKVREERAEYIITYQGRPTAIQRQQDSGGSPLNTLSLIRGDPPLSCCLWMLTALRQSW